MTDKRRLNPDSFWRLSVGQYEQMIQLDILTADDPVELLEGCLIKKMPKKPSHSSATELTSEEIRQLLPNGWYVRTEQPIVTDDSEPEPDLSIVRGVRRDYTTRHPKAREVAIVIEVADTTRGHDRGLKKRLYARAGIPVYVIINLRERLVELYTDPTGPGDEPDYVTQRYYRPTEALPLVLEGQKIGQIAVRDLLP